MAVNCSEAEMVITPEPPQGTKDTGQVVMVKLYTDLFTLWKDDLAVEMQLVWSREVEVLHVGENK